MGAADMGAADMGAPRLARIVSGGQSGVDRAALDAATAAGVPYGGWCPAGGWAEDLVEPPGLLRLYPLLRETESADPEERTRRNVRDSDAVLLVRPGAGAAASSPGSDLTARVAADLARPLMETGTGRTAVGEVAAWLRALPRGVVLDVAGPRESERPGVYAEALAFLRAVLARLDEEASPSPGE